MAFICLHFVHQALDVKKVDMFSLDVEGGEFDVLNTIDFNKIDIDIFVIEHGGRLSRFREFFKNIKFNDSHKKYSEIKENGQDIFFRKI